VRLVTRLYGSPGPALYVGMSTHTTDPVRLTIDDDVAAAAITRIRWRLASSGPWSQEHTFAPPFAELVIERPALTDVEIEVTWRPGAFGQRYAARTRGRVRGERPVLRGPALREHRRRGAGEPGGTRTTLYTLPGTRPVIEPRA
jgi:hypothetical protein